LICKWTNKQRLWYGSNKRVNIVTAIVIKRSNSKLILRTDRCLFVF